jgi:hypothetical protein
MLHRTMMLILAIALSGTTASAASGNQPHEDRIFGLSSAPGLWDGNFGHHYGQAFGMSENSFGVFGAHHKHHIPDGQPFGISSGPGVPKGFHHGHHGHHGHYPSHNVPAPEVGMGLIGIMMAGASAYLARRRGQRLAEA